MSRLSGVIRLLAGSHLTIQTLVSIYMFRVLVVLGVLPVMLVVLATR